MNVPEQVQIEELAKIEGYKYDSGRGWFDMNGQKLISGIPDYLHPIEGYNPLHRIINAMIPEILREYYYIQLNLILTKQENERGKLHYDCEKALATPAQMAEAVLKAYDKWED